MNFAIFAGSYLLGSIPFGVLIARRKGIDIQKVGSGNTGATNVWRTLGPGAGSLTFVLDVLKGLLPALAGSILLGSQEQALLCGVLAMLGHTFSPFLKFRGGKGVATSLGALLGAAPAAAGIGLGVFALLFAATRIVSLSSLIAAFTIALISALLYDSIAVRVALGILMLYIVVRHKDNIRRLLQGTEPRFEFKPKQEDPVAASPEDSN